MSEYDATQWLAYMDIVSSSVRTLGMVPVAEMLDELNRMQTVAPILEPTAYVRGGGDNLRDQEELLRAVLQVQRAMEQILNRRLGTTRIA